MRYPAELTAQRHEEILEVAACLIREQGFDMKVADVMRGAGLTHGAFYAHFSSKDALLADAASRAVRQIGRTLEQASAAPDPRAAFCAGYLSPEHRDAPGQGCAIAALGPEISRAPAPVQNAVGQALSEVIDKMAETFTGRADEAGRGEALRTFATLIGAVILARIGGSELSDEVLRAAAQPPAPPTD